MDISIIKYTIMCLSIHKHAAAKSQIQSQTINYSITRPPKSTHMFKSCMCVKHDQLLKLFKSDLALGTISDVLSFALPLSVELKQELLEELHVEQRVRRLLHYLETTEPPKQKESPASKFPPEFSSN